MKVLIQQPDCPLVLSLSAGCALLVVYGSSGGGYGYTLLSAG